MYVESHNFTSDFMWDDENGILFQRDMGANDIDQRWWSGGEAPFW